MIQHSISILQRGNHMLTLQMLPPALLSAGCMARAAPTCSNHTKEINIILRSHNNQNRYVAVMTVLGALPNTGLPAVPRIGLHRDCAMQSSPSNSSTLSGVAAETHVFALMWRCTLSKRLYT